MAKPAIDARLKHEADGFTEVTTRGKGSLTSRNPSTGQFAFTSQVGNVGWHFGAEPFDEAHEVDTAWVTGDSTPYRLKMELADYNAFAGLDDAINFDAGQIVQYVHPDTGESVSFQPQQLQWTNDLDQISAIGDVETVPAVIDDDKLIWADAFGTDLDFQWQTQTARLQKLLTIQNLAAIGTPPQFIIDGGNPVLQLQFIYQRSSGVRTWVDGVEFNEKNTSELTTSNDIEFRLESTGEVLWYFTAPRGWDGENEKLSPLMRVRGTAQNLFVEVRVPWAWLESAVYPVYIDPTIDYQVSSSAYDSIQKEIGETGEPTSDDRFVVASPGGAGNYEYVAVQWLAVTIPDGATIDTSYAQWKTSDFGIVDMDTTIDFEDASAPSAFGLGANDITNRTGTTATVTWNATLNDGVFNSTPSLNSIISELMASYSYASGLTMCGRLNSNSTDACALNGYLQASGDAAKLHIEYTAGAAGRTTYNTDAQTHGIRTGISLRTNV